MVGLIPLILCYGTNFYLFDDSIHSQMIMIINIFIFICQSWLLCGYDWPKKPPSRMIILQMKTQMH